ncbi:hypothetical protein I314_00253 [Cryptococcus bacillisporus CA1873]|uniref:Integral membrane bound transporter domain-containing protein n=1 Tax=Cryptococcus bacillisporus CA1873 TaxID=1296111 RepID=A0ABR5BJ12_CRYGA|nr:hypothetical protein I314_00253 [Cryptococcus bacillisporus CA1873]|eukprot:KIR69149.1 hypothetical protein I314_00253 [Cryptococcus gattii CA1873]
MEWIARLRPLGIATLTAFLCFVSAAVKPWARISGEWGFLVYTSSLIFFFPRGRIGPQIEATVLGIFGGTIGIGWSNGTLAVAAWCGRRYGADSNQARAILSIGLALLCIASGLIRSYSRRFNAFSKIMLFFPIFMLTSQQSILHMSASLFLEQFYVVIFSGTLPLLVTVVFAPHHSLSHRFGSEVSESIKSICTLLPLSFHHILGDGSLPETGEGDSESPINAKRLEAQLQDIRPTTQDQLAKKLKAVTSNLQSSSSSYLRTTPRVEGQFTALPAVVKALQRMGRNPLLGPASHIPGERIQAALHKSFPPSAPPSPRRRHKSSKQPIHKRDNPVSAEVDLNMENSTRRKVPRHLTSYNPPRDLSPNVALSSRPGLKDESHRLLLTMVQTLHSINQVLPSKFGWSVVTLTDGEADVVSSENLQESKRFLEEELLHIQRTLGSLLGDVDPDQSGASNTTSPSNIPHNHVGSPVEHHVTFSETPEVKSVLHNRDRYRLAFYMTALLDLARDVLGLTETILNTPDYERPSSVWLASLRLLWVNRQDEVDIAADGKSAENDLVSEEERPVDELKEYQDMDFVTAMLHQSHSASSITGPKHSIQRTWKLLWNQHRVVKARIILSRAMHTIKHSRHVLFSIKLAGGICLLSVPAWMPPDNSARHWYESSRGGWMVVSYMFVLEDTTGAILKVGFLRGLGTLIGAIVGYVCTVIAKKNAYGLVVLATACSVPISYNVLFASLPGLGVATGITLPPILFIPYLGLAEGQSDFYLAWNRFVDIMIGTAAAVLVGTWIWPVHARVQYFRAAARMLAHLTEYYLRMSRDLVRSSLVYCVDDKQYEQLEAKLRGDVQLARALVAVQRQEVSLLPRPIKLYSEIIDAGERLLELLIEIRILRFGVPRKETVLDVLPIRRELISTVLINLWSCSHAFGSRSPLLQFLPSPRVPLSELMDVTEEHARHLRALRKQGANSSVGNEGNVQAPGVTFLTGSYQAELAVLYGMAENEALGEMCSILEELVAAARTLFGTQAFLETS